MLAHYIGYQGWGGSSGVKYELLEIPGVDEADLVSDSPLCLFSNTQPEMEVDFFRSMMLESKWKYRTVLRADRKPEGLGFPAL